MFIAQIFIVFRDMFFQSASLQSATCVFFKTDTRFSSVAYFNFLADCFKMCGEHCLCVECSSKIVCIWKKELLRVLLFDFSANQCDNLHIYCPATRQCLNKTLQCNKKQDCPDWSDEANCGRINPPSSPSLSELKTGA